MLFIRELRETLGRFPCNRGPDGRAAAAAVAAGGLAVVLAVTVLVEIVAGSADAASPVT